MAARPSHFRVPSCSEFQKPSQTAAERGEAELRILNFKTPWSEFHHLPRVVVCVSTPRMYPQSRYFLVVVPVSLSSAQLMQFFQKARIEKNGKNEPIWGLFKNIIWKSLILTKKRSFFFLDNSPKGPFSVKKLVKISQKSQI